MRRKLSSYIILAVLVLGVGGLSLTLQLAPYSDSTVLGWLDAPLQDSLFRLRNAALEQPVSDQITLVGIDDQTQRVLGLYGRGVWLSRKPFRDQVPYYLQVYRPRVLAYDIIFGETQGEGRRANAPGAAGSAVAGDEAFLPSHLHELGPYLEQTRAPDVSVISDVITRHGNLMLAETFAELQVAGDDAIPTILGYALPDGRTRSFSEVDPELGFPPAILGDDPDDPDEDYGRTIYLRELSIPGQFVRNVPADYAWYEYAELPSANLLDYCQLGYLNVPRDHDGAVRRVPLLSGLRYAYTDPDTEERVERAYFLPAFSLLAVLNYWGIDLADLHYDEAFVDEQGRPTIEVELGEAITVRKPDGSVARIPVDRRGFLPLDFVGRIHDFPTVPFHMVTPASSGGGVHPQVPPRLEDKIVMVGLTATGTTDVGPCPVDAHTPFVHMHMVAASNILTQTFIRPLRTGETVLVYGLCLVLMLPCALLLRPFHLTLATGVLALGYLGVAFWQVASHRFILPLAGPALLFFGASYLGVLLHHYLVEARERRKIRGMFSTMVSGEVLRYMEENPGSFSLTGEKREATMFFSDVAGFTTISEKLSAENLALLLNKYLTPMTDIIQDSNGYVDKYEGDAIMAEWGVPYPAADHARRACYAALDQQERLAELRPQFEQEFDVTVRVRMGINSGTVSAGNMGSGSRFSYTVMGDAVNQAARFEPACKDYDVYIMIGASTYEQAKEFIEVRHLDKIIVKGKTVPIDIYELLARKGELSPAMTQVVQHYHQALERQWDRDWEGAIAELDKGLAILPDDGPCRRLKERLEAYQVDPPGENWQGEYVRKTKD